MEENIKQEEKNFNKKNNKENKKQIVILVVLIFIFLFLDLCAFLISYASGKKTVAKPIIYLYPTQDEVITVSLGNKEKITSSYPKYVDGWKVLAKPNGDLKYLKTNQNLYSLYYENRTTMNYKIEKEGFCIEGKNTAIFLEDKLAKLGLTEREKEEFIIYWLPKLENNKYNYIRFASKEEIDTDMPLNITPLPDTTIRVLMTFKGLNRPVDVKEQKIITPEREGFVAVEWGGTEIK